MGTALSERRYKTMRRANLARRATTTVVDLVRFASRDHAHAVATVDGAHSRFQRRLGKVIGEDRHGADPDWDLLRLEQTTRAFLERLRGAPLQRFEMPCLLETKGTKADRAGALRAVAALAEHTPALQELGFEWDRAGKYTSQILSTTMQLKASDARRSETCFESDCFFSESVLGGVPVALGGVAGVGPWRPPWRPPWRLGETGIRWLTEGFALGMRRGFLDYSEVLSPEERRGKHQDVSRDTLPKPPPPPPPRWSVQERQDWVPERVGVAQLAHAAPGADVAGDPDSGAPGSSRATGVCLGGGSADTDVAGKFRCRASGLGTAPLPRNARRGRIRRKRGGNGRYAGTQSACSCHVVCA
jgi:hypothetical protein